MPGLALLLLGLRPATGAPGTARYGAAVTRHDAHQVVEGFMYSRIARAQGKLEWLITPRALAMFHKARLGVPEPLYAGSNYRIVGLRPKPGRPGVFNSRVRLFLQGRLAVELGVPVIRETILVGPGKSVGGEKLPLLVIRARPG